jgi:hypothetical protein
MYRRRARSQFLGEFSAGNPLSFQRLAGALHSPMHTRTKRFELELDSCRFRRSESDVELEEKLTAERPGTRDRVDIRGRE